MDKKDLEALAILQEECAEVIQAVSKILRFGVDNTWNGRTARQDLEDEIGDVQAMIGILLERQIINEDHVVLAEARKIEKLHRWSSLFDENA